MGKTILTAILGTILAGAILAGCGGAGPEPLDEVGIEATRQAMALEATRTVLDLERQKLDMEREQLDLERDTRRQEALDPFVLALPWVVLVAGLGAAGLVGWRWLTVWELRARVIRRQPEEGEPIQLLSHDRVALPLRLANAYADLTRGAERSPMLAANAEAQERATMRQQASNLALASQAARTVKARTGSSDISLMLPPAEKHERSAPAPSPVRVLQEPTETVRGWIEDTERALLPEVVSDD